MSKALSIDKPVDGNLKVVKDSDGSSTALSLSNDTVRVKNLEVSGTSGGIGLNDINEITFSEGTGETPSGDLTFPTLRTLATEMSLDIESGGTIKLESYSGVTCKGTALTVQVNTGATVFFRDGDNITDIFATIDSTSGHGKLNLYADGAASSPASMGTNADSDLNLVGTDIFLDSGGDIILDPYGKQIYLDTATTRFGSIDMATGSTLKLIGETDYKVQIISQGTGDINLTSADDITIDATDALIFDSDGTYVMKQDGAEYSVANSAYAGMILGYRMIGEDAVKASYAFTTSYAIPDSAMTVRFEAPPSGAVEVTVQFYMDGTSGRYNYIGLSDNATYNSIGNSYEQSLSLADETDFYTMQHMWVVTGLTAGDTYNYWMGVKSNHASGYIRWGGSAADRYPDFIMKVVALPTAVSDYAEYD